MKQQYENDHPDQFRSIPEQRMCETDQIKSADWEQRYERILKESDAILAAEGHYHVAGVYYANQDDATFQRMLLAEQRVRETERSMDRYLAKGRELKAAS